MAGEVVLDSYVAPSERVTDLRTGVSGIRHACLRGAPPFQRVQARPARARAQKCDRECARAGARARARACACAREHTYRARMWTRARA